MQKLEILRADERHSRGTLESGRWGLAKCRPICSCEAPKLRETETVGNFRDLNLVRVGVAQRETDFLQPAQQHILGGGYAEKFGAARPKGPVAHYD